MLYHPRLAPESRGGPAVPDPLVAGVEFAVGYMSADWSLRMG